MTRASLACRTISRFIRNRVLQGSQGIGFFKEVRGSFWLEWSLLEAWSLILR